MFKQLLAVLKKGDLVSQALRDTQVMLEKANRLFNVTVVALVEQKPVEFDIYEMDREINNLEKKIRRKVLEHLSINPRQEIVSTLVLTSIIISIERIGDYSKNIYELVKLCSDKEKIKIDQKLKEDTAFISSMFNEVEKAFTEGDGSQALSIMNKLNPVKKGFDTYISESVSKTECSIREAVVNALFSRFLKRVSAHLENIASGIANPFEMIGFYSGDRDKKTN